MENNSTLPNDQQSVPSSPSVSPASVQPAQTVNSPVSASEKPKSGAGKKLLLVIVLILLLVGILGGGYYLYLNNKTTHNVNTYNAPTTSVTPTPQAYQPNPKDTSDQALNSDSSQASQNLNNIDSSLNAVDQGLNDQQTNLQ